MDKWVFPGRALAPVSGDRVDGVARRGAGMDRSADLADRMVRPVDPSDIGFIIGTSFGNGYRLTGDPSYKSVLLTTGGTLASPSLYNSKVGAVLSWTFPPYEPPYHFAVTVDSMMTARPVAVGGRQWRQFYLGRNSGDARPDGDHEPGALGWQHV